MQFPADGGLGKLIFRLSLVCIILFWEQNKHQFWIDQSLFFHLHVSFNTRNAMGLELSAVTQEVAQVLR
jgi:hypothetical protein